MCVLKRLDHIINMRHIYTLINGTHLVMPKQHNKRKHICETTDKGECKESINKIHCYVKYESQE